MKQTVATTMHPQSANKDRKSSTVSLLSLFFMTTVASAIFSKWNESKSQITTKANRGGGSFVYDDDDGIETSSYASLRNMLETSEEFNDNEPSVVFDDDGEPTATCKEYLKNFLNDTTDSHDQCEGMDNAYRDGGCAKKDKDDSNYFPYLDHQHEGENGTVVDDDKLIDDYFENWECCDAIKNYYKNHCQEEEGLHSIRLLGIMLVLLVCTIVKAMTKRCGVHWLPDACAFIIVGAIVGGILRLVFGSDTVEQKLSFDNDLFLQILLPPIIFQAALSIDKRAFRRDLFPILAFASLGTAFSAIAIGLVAHYVSSFMGDDAALPLMDSLVFGSLISSIDPVATLGILAQVGVSQTDTLYVLIFGESLLNDGVAIVLFDTLKSYVGDENAQLNESAYKQIALHFVAILFGSIGIGLLCGTLCTIYFWALRGRQTAVTEVMIFFTWSFIPYYIADGSGCSGIIAIMVMGFFLDYFVIGGFQSEESSWLDHMAQRNEAERGATFNNHGIQPTSRWDQFQSSMQQAFSGRGHILSRSRHHVGFVAHVIAALMDTAIFAYLGLFLFNDNVWHFRLSMTAILGCVSSRAIMVLGLSLIVNVFVYLDVEGALGRLFQNIRRINPILHDDDDIMERVYLDRKTQMILLLAGVRGAVSFALMESIPVYDSVTKMGSKFKPEIKAMTSSSIVFTLFVFGALTYFMVEFGGPSNGSGERRSGNLTHRLLSEATLDSDDDGNTDADIRSEINSLAMEVEQSYTPMSFQAQQFREEQQRREQGQGQASGEQQPQMQMQYNAPSDPRTVSHDVQQLQQQQPFATQTQDATQFEQTL
eukprot:CAMPEP_0119554582 /NCGR_PEP_ID=MMETSP1352-20130426/7035_1 /TAXON_ID=265584 /ORGANISM="Stauroneis constricta, Strain CCMP1120" /LENGTH=820 /DNA_ID=CAMNT_0007601195 /DNA_START=182 /DNA_END=2644 /DNA_ORIENTATION=+